MNRALIISYLTVITSVMMIRCSAPQCPTEEYKTTVVKKNFSHYNTTKLATLICKGKPKECIELSRLYVPNGFPTESTTSFLLYQLL